jgi:hypothetical protein
MRYRTISALVILALAGSLEAGCSSSASPSSSPSSTPPAATTSAAAAALPAADCAVIKPIAAGALATLAPLQTEATSAAATALGQYLTELNTDLAKLTSAQGKADLGAFISALSKPSSASTQAAVSAALAKLGTDCP